MRDDDASEFVRDVRRIDARTMREDEARARRMENDIRRSRSRRDEDDPSLHSGSTLTGGLRRQIMGDKRASKPLLGFVFGDGKDGKDGARDPYRRPGDRPRRPHNDDWDDEPRPAARRPGGRSRYEDDYDERAPSQSRRPPRRDAEDKYERPLRRGGRPREDDALDRPLKSGERSGGYDELDRPPRSGERHVRSRAPPLGDEDDYDRPPRSGGRGPRAPRSPVDVDPGRPSRRSGTLPPRGPPVDEVIDTPPRRSGTRPTRGPPEGDAPPRRSGARPSGRPASLKHDAYLVEPPRRSGRNDPPLEAEIDRPPRRAGARVPRGPPPLEEDDFEQPPPRRSVRPVRGPVTADDDEYEPPLRMGGRVPRGSLRDDDDFERDHEPPLRPLDPVADVEADARPRYSRTRLEAPAVDDEYYERPVVASRHYSRTNDGIEREEEEVRLSGNGTKAVRVTESREETSLRRSRLPLPADVDEVDPPLPPRGGKLSRSGQADYSVEDEVEEVVVDQVSRDGDKLTRRKERHETPHASVRQTLEVEGDSGPTFRLPAPEDVSPPTRRSPRGVDEEEVVEYEASPPPVVKRLSRRIDEQAPSTHSRYARDDDDIHPRSRKVEKSKHVLADERLSRGARVRRLKEAQEEHRRRKEASQENSSEDEEAPRSRSQTPDSEHERDANTRDVHSALKAPTAKPVVPTKRGGLVQSAQRFQQEDSGSSDSPSSLRQSSSPEPPTPRISPKPPPQRKLEDAIESKPGAKAKPKPLARAKPPTVLPSQNDEDNGAFLEAARSRLRRGNPDVLAQVPAEPEETDEPKIKPRPKPKPKPKASLSKPGLDRFADERRDSVESQSPEEEAGFKMPKLRPTSSPTRSDKREEDSDFTKPALRPPQVLRKPSNKPSEAVRKLQELRATKPVLKPDTPKPEAVSTRGSLRPKTSVRHESSDPNMQALTDQLRQLRPRSQVEYGREGENDDASDAASRSSSSDSLHHPTKSRAKGPKRRLPTYE